MSETDDRTWWERLLDERAALAGAAIEVVVIVGGLGWLSAGAVAAITGVLRQVVTPHRTARGKRRRAQRRNRRDGRRNHRHDPLVQPWRGAPPLRNL